MFNRSVNLINTSSDQVWEFSQSVQRHDLCFVLGMTDCGCSVLQGHNYVHHITQQLNGC